MSPLLNDQKPMLFFKASGDLKELDCIIQGVIKCDKERKIAASVSGSHFLGYLLGNTEKNTKCILAHFVKNELTFSRNSSTLLLSNTTSWKGSNFISEGLHRLDKTASCDMDFILSTPMNMQD